MDKYIKFYHVFLYNRFNCFSKYKLLEKLQYKYRKKQIYEIESIKEQLYYLSIKRYSSIIYNSFMTDIYFYHTDEKIEHHKNFHRIKLLLYLKYVKLYINYCGLKINQDIILYKKLKILYLKKYGKIKKRKDRFNNLIF